MHCQVHKGTAGFLFLMSSKEPILPLQEGILTPDDPQQTDQPTVEGGESWYVFDLVLQYVVSHIHAPVPWLQ